MATISARAAEAPRESNTRTTIKAARERSCVTAVGEVTAARKPRHTFFNFSFIGDSKPGRLSTERRRRQFCGLIVWPKQTKGAEMVKSLLIGLLAALVTAVPAQAKLNNDGFGTGSGTYVYIGQGKAGGDAMGEFGGGNACWTSAGWYVGDHTPTGNWEWHVEDTWCGNGNVTSIGPLNRWPVVSGWYSFAGDDGAWITGGCVGCSYVTVKTQGRFQWSAPVFGTLSNHTAWMELWMSGGGGLYLQSYN